MARITIKTKAYARNAHFNDIFEALRTQGHSATPNVAIDGEVSIDTNAPSALCRALVTGRPTKSVWVVL
jgi:hypothetical protein